MKVDNMSTIFKNRQNKTPDDTEEEDVFEEEEENPNDIGNKVDTDNVPSLNTQQSKQDMFFSQHMNDNMNDKMKIYGFGESNSSDVDKMSMLGFNSQSSGENINDKMSMLGFNSQSSGEDVGKKMDMLGFNMQGQNVGKKMDMFGLGMGQRQGQGQGQGQNIGKKMDTFGLGMQGQGQGQNIGKKMDMFGLGMQRQGMGRKMGTFGLGMQGQGQRQGMGRKMDILGLGMQGQGQGQGQGMGRRMDMLGPHNQLNQFGIQIKGKRKMKKNNTLKKLEQFGIPNYSKKNSFGIGNKQMKSLFQIPNSSLNITKKMSNLVPALKLNALNVEAKAFNLMVKHPEQIARKRIDQQKYLSMFGDFDNDKLANILDCNPMNINKQGMFHSVKNMFVPSKYKSRPIYAKDQLVESGPGFTKFKTRAFTTTIDNKGENIDVSEIKNNSVLGKVSGFGKYVAGKGVSAGKYVAGKGVSAGKYVGKKGKTSLSTFIHGKPKERMFFSPIRKWQELKEQKLSGQKYKRDLLAAKRKALLEDTSLSAEEREIRRKQLAQEEFNLRKEELEAEKAIATEKYKAVSIEESRRDKSGFYKRDKFDSRFDRRDKGYFDEVRQGISAGLGGQIHGPLSDEQAKISAFMGGVQPTSIGSKVMESVGAAQSTGKGVFEGLGLGIGLPQSKSFMEKLNETMPLTKTLTQKPTLGMEYEPTAEVAPSEPTAEVASSEPTAEIVPSEPTAEVAPSEPTAEVTLPKVAPVAQYQPIVLAPRPAAPGYPPPGYPQQGYPQQGYPQQGYPPAAPEYPPKYKEGPREKVYSSRSRKDVEYRRGPYRKSRLREMGK